VGGIVLGYNFPSVGIKVIPLPFFSLYLVYFFYGKRKLVLSDVFILIFFLSLGFLWTVPLSFHNPEKFTNKERIFTIKVLSLPKETSLKYICQAKIKRIDNYQVNLLVKVNDFTKKLEYLGEYKVKGKLTAVKYKNNYFYTLWLKKTSLKEEFPFSGRDIFLKKVTSGINNILEKKLPPSQFRFLSSVFLGRREMLDKKTKLIFVEAGVSHLLAISGLHIGLLGLIVFFTLKIFNIKFRVRILASILFLYFYISLVGWRASTQRAFIMYTISAVSFLMRRKVNLINSFSWAGIFSLLLNPYSIFDVGFQLSYLAVFSLIWGFKLFPLKGRFKIGMMNYLRNIFFSSFFVSVGITPVVSYYFGKVYPLGVINNIFLIPLFTLLLMTTFIFIIVSPCEFFSQLVANSLSFFIFIFINAAHRLSPFHLSFTFSPLAILVYYFSLCLLFILIKSRVLWQNKVIQKWRCCKISKNGSHLKLVS